MDPTRNNPTDWPLVAVVVYAWNEVRFIRDAVRSILAQDYPELEVVLSDDGSTDGTWEAMQELASDYGGPHRIHLNRNPRNIGIGSQINAAVAMTTADLLVLANGDDISDPTRIRRTVEVWRGTSPHCTAIWTDLGQIDAHGNLLTRVMPCVVDTSDLVRAVANRFCGVPAASLALDRQVFDAFGPLPANLMLEDNPLLARAVLLGPVRRIAETLVHYRVHDDNISQAYAVTDFATWHARNQERLVWHKHQDVKAYIEILRDLHQSPAQSHDAARVARARWMAMEKLMLNAMQRDYYDGNHAVGDAIRWRSLLHLALQLAKLRIKRWLPFIERRNAVAQYRRVKRAAGVQD